MGVIVDVCGTSEPTAFLIVLRPISTCIIQTLHTTHEGGGEGGGGAPA